MSPAPSPIRSRLRSIPPEQARLQTELIGALNSRVLDGLQTTARLASARDRSAANAWIEFETAHGRVSIAPLLVDGALARMTGPGNRPDGAAAAATLGQIEPLVAALETALGAELQPSGLSLHVADAALLVRLDAHAGQAGIRHRLIVAVPAAMTIAPLPLPLRAGAPVAVARFRPPWVARVAGPLLAPAQIAKLGAGDMILCGIGPLVAKLSLPGRNDLLGASVNWAAATLHVGGGRVPGEKPLNIMDEPPIAGDATTPEWQSMRLPTSIEIDGAGLTAVEIATIAQGSVLPLPVQGGTIAVRVRAGDTLIAEGELVAVGEGFGVLVTGVPARPAD